MRCPSPARSSVPHPSRRRITSLALALALAVGALAGCGGDGAPDKLTLRITSDVPVGGQSLESLRVLLRHDDGTRFPEDPASPAFNLALGADNDPTRGPLFAAIDYGGATFATPDVFVQVTGRVGAKVVTQIEAPARLGDRKVVHVHLVAMGDLCDADGDGFVDCNVEGCCPGGTKTGLSDCAPDDPSSHPWAYEDPCEPCDDTADQDCDGEDVPCIDEDQDGIADCAEVACGLGDPNRGPGLPEKCDDVDNDCDGLTDEDAVWSHGGQSYPKGAECGVGACAGGQVVCAADGSAVCSSVGNALAAEICGNGVDDDCNGLTDEGCLGADLDGDGFTSGAGDCDDHDSGVFPGAAEGCCPLALRDGDAVPSACDRDCDGEVTWCAAGDLDGDGFTEAAGDCDDSDASVYPGAPEKCGDGVDQDCFGGDVDCATVVDADGDGWSPPADCNDADPDVHPGAAEVCNGKDDDCDGYVDDGNPDTNDGGPCGETEGECEAGVSVCSNSSGKTGEVICIGFVGPAAETCDGKDNDCDGGTDEDFTYEGAPVGQACDGVGECGLGQVECNPAGDGATCSTNADGSDPDVQPEQCDTLDHDCDGQVNNGLGLEQSPCSLQGVCGAAGAVVVATCDTGGTWTCDYSGVPGYEADAEKTCDGLDNDCDGTADEEFLVNTGCDGDDEDQCLNGTVKCAPDQVSTYCDETNAANAVEVCDGQDNDCDGETDEDFVDLGEPCDGTDLDMCKNGTRVCAADAKGTTCAETIVNIQEICDGIDNDCDGQTDEGFPKLGEACDSDDSDLCKNGTFTCKADGLGVECVNETATNLVDVCDGLDNDCDGQTDEDFPTLGDACDGADSDLCQNGTVTCAADGSAVECVNESVTDIVDTCNGLDDDCDGETDEDYVAGGTVTYDGGPYAGDAGKVKGASCGTGACASGTVVCAAGGLGLTCDTLTKVAVELCNGVDDDCDAETDEDWKTGGTFTYDGGPYAADAGKVLGDACGAGECAGGQVVCATGATLTCDTAGKASDDLCNDKDDDCDGETDEAFGPGGTVAFVGLYWGDEGKVKGDACGAGECAGGSVACSGDGQALVCGTESGAQPETCNDKDDDCDGTVNEDPVDVAEANCKAVGVCSVAGAVEAVCSPTGSWSCNYLDEDYVATESGAGAAYCDGQDNDCNGVTDEGFPDQDGDAQADCVDPDIDGDGIPDNVNVPSGYSVKCGDGVTTNCNDNCPTTENPAQGDQDDDGLGDACDTDRDGDGVANVSDNCPSTPNADQVDTDGDGLGNACDPDDDDDGVLDANGPVCDGSQKTCSDNCPLVPNPDQTDTDLDGVGDACDDDIDGDGVLDLADADPCSGGNTTGCSDNCPLDPNPDQRDTDEDGVGDACEACPATTLPFDVCGDCIDNDCDGVADNDASCVYQRALTVTAGDAVAAGYSLYVDVNHKALVDAGMSNADGSDVRIYYTEPGGAVVEIDRVADPVSHPPNASLDLSWNKAFTRIWFKAQAPLAAGASTTAYRLTWGHGGSAKGDEKNVFHFADFFDRANSTTVTGWSENEPGSTDIRIQGNALKWEDSGDTSYPGATATFSSLTSGSYIWRFGFNWQRTGNEGSYDLFMQFGDGLSLANNVVTNTGVGPSLRWSSSGATHQVLFTDEPTADSAVITTGLSGPRRIDVITHLTSPTTGGVAGTYDLYVDYAEIAQSALFRAPLSMTGLNSVRLFTSGLNEGNFDSRQFDYVLVRHFVANEPKVTLAGKEDTGCAMANTGLLARYYLDDGTSGTTPTTVADAASDPLDLALTTSSGSPSWTTLNGQKGLSWSTVGTAARASAPIAGTKVHSALHNAKTATIELVFDAEAFAATSKLFSLGAGASNRLTVFGEGANSSRLFLAAAGVAKAGSWVMDPLSSGQVIVHVVYDSAHTATGSRSRLYVNGFPVTNEAAGIPANAGIDLNGGTFYLTVGNGGGSNAASMQGVITYAALYGHAFTHAEVLKNVGVLYRDDDTRK